MGKTTKWRYRPLPHVSKSKQNQGQLTIQWTIRLRNPQRIPSVLAKVGDDIPRNRLEYHGRQKALGVLDAFDFADVYVEDFPLEDRTRFERRGEIRLAEPARVRRFELERQVRQVRYPRRRRQTRHAREFAEDGRIDDGVGVLHVRAAVIGSVVVVECEDEGGVRV